MIFSIRNNFPLVRIISRMYALSRFKSRMIDVRFAVNYRWVVLRVISIAMEVAY